jgi:hypothetical protein
MFPVVISARRGAFITGKDLKRQAAMFFQYEILFRALLFYATQAVPNECAKRVREWMFFGMVDAGRSA